MGPVDAIDTAIRTITVRDAQEAARAAILARAWIVELERRRHHRASEILTSQ